MEKGIYEVFREAWGRVGERVLGDEAELRRRLERREKVFDRVPRPFCLAVRASDRRIGWMNAWIGPRWATKSGEELEHDVLVTSELVLKLCWPVQVLHGELMTEVAKRMGCSFERARAMEQRGVIRTRAISLLAGRHGHPVPMTDGRRLLDPCAKGKGAPHELLVPMWQFLTWRVPAGIEQIVRRKPVFAVIRRQLRFLRWVWVCPGCGREVRTIYLPMGAPDWAHDCGIKLPGDEWYETPHQPECFACAKCHKVANISTSTKRKVGEAWGMLVRHMSGGLLYGREVERPASFGVVRKHRAYRVGRAAPRRDEVERYLAETELSFAEIARRMGWRYRSVHRYAWRVYKLRGVKGREELRERRAGERKGEAA